MARTTQEIAADICAFEPIDGNWLGLDALQQELWKQGTPQDAIAVLLRVLERFPEEDGNGVFWAIVHSLESLDGYETQLARSVRRAPAAMSATMLGRLLNAGTLHIDRISIRDLLIEVVGRSDIGPNTRDRAQLFLEHHQGSDGRDG